MNYSVQVVQTFFIKPVEKIHLFERSVVTAFWSNTD
uniref:Uncharacterized protein n=1 Tax=Arundo donax TaxID=35708 RepID=A0A0A9CFA9_ARUDO